MALRLPGANRGGRILAKNDSAINRRGPRSGSLFRFTPTLPQAKARKIRPAAAGIAGVDTNTGNSLKSDAILVLMPLSTGTVMSMMRLELVCFPGFFALARLGENRSVDRLIVFGSGLLLALMKVGFSNAYPVL
jgi:hypothetical protein